MTAPSLDPKQVEVAKNGLTYLDAEKTAGRDIQAAERNLEKAKQGALNSLGGAETTLDNMASARRQKGLDVGADVKSVQAKIGEMTGSNREQPAADNTNTNTGLKR